MGVEPYLLTSGIRGILNQRLLRRLCPSCRARPEALGNCQPCAGTGYRGRLLVAEYVTLDASLRQAILKKSDTAALEEVARRAGRATLRDVAGRAVLAGRTTAVEVERVLGPGDAMGVDQCTPTT
jgi:general secretion pathway protein E